MFKLIKNLCIIAGLLFTTSIWGCGSSPAQSPQTVGDDIVRNKFSSKSLISAVEINLPQEMTGEWGSVNDLCKVVGYDLTPYAGQGLSLAQYVISEVYQPDVTIQTDFLGNGPTTTLVPPLLLYLWVISKDGTTVGAYITARDDIRFQEYLHLGIISTGMFAINDAHIE